jgi:hypothetical protein
MALGIAQGLEFLHSRRIVHRDVKPANVLLQGETPRLTDFGMSRVVLGKAVSMQVSGTPYYMAPEAFSRKRDRQTDIWSLGVVLYEMLTGEMPFPGEDVDQICYAVLHERPVPMPKTIPRDLRDIVLRALQKSPDDRYASATDLRADLQRVYRTIDEDPEPITDSAPSPPDDNRRKLKLPFFNRTQLLPERGAGQLERRRFSIRPAIAVILLVALAAAAAGVLMMNRPNPVPMRAGAKFGFSSWSRVPAIEARYDLARPFSDDRALIGTGGYDESGRFVGKFGFIDPAGVEVIAANYDHAESFSEKLALIGLETHAGRRFGFVGSDGLIAIAVNFEDARSFSESLAAAKFNGKWGFIDRTGAAVVPYRYDAAMSFSSGFAVVRAGDKFGYVSRDGREAIAPEFEIAGDFSAGRAPVKRDGRTFFIDTAGREIPGANFNEASPFGDGLAMVSIDGRSGFIDANGVVAIPFIYDCPSARFSEGLAAVPLNGRYGYIDRKGVLAIPFRYVEAEPFKGGLARVRDVSGRDYYIGFDGTEFVDR